MPINIKSPQIFANESTLAAVLEGVSGGLTELNRELNPNLPSFVLNDEEFEEFGSPEDFTERAKKILNSEEFTRGERNNGLRVLKRQGRLVVEKVTQQQKFNEAIVTRNGIEYILRGNGDWERLETDDPTRPSGADVAKTAQRLSKEAFTRLTNRNDRPPTPKELDAEVRLLLEAERRAIGIISGEGQAQADLESLIERQGTDTPQPSAQDFGFLLPEEGAVQAPQEPVPETEEELSAALAAKMEEFTRMSPEGRRQALEEMPEEERELFLDLLPEKIQKRLEAIEKRIKKAAEGSKERRSLINEYMLILTTEDLRGPLSRKPAALSSLPGGV